MRPDSMTFITVCSVCTVDLYAVQRVFIEYHMHMWLSNFNNLFFYLDFFIYANEAPKSLQAFFASSKTSPAISSVLLVPLQNTTATLLILIPF